MRTIASTAFISVGTTLIAVALLLGRTTTSPLASPLLPVGTESAAGQAASNGFVLPTAPCNIADTVAGASTILGPAISSFTVTGRSMGFEFGRLACSPNDPSKGVVFANTGLDYLQRIGVVPQPGSAAHPLLSEFLNSSQRAGLPASFYGSIVSKPFHRNGLEIQATDRAVFVIDQQDHMVRLAPAGCWLDDNCQRLALAVSETRLADFFHPLVIASIAAIVLGVVLLIQRSSGLRSELRLA